MIVKFWRQETLADGAVSAWSATGVKSTNATQEVAEFRPTKLGGNGGVLFQKGARQALVWGRDNDAPLLHRWWLVIARCDSNRNRRAEFASVVCVNGIDGGAVYRQPRVHFMPSDGHFACEFNDGAGKTEFGPCSGSFDEWNVLLGFRRSSRFQAVVNGVKTPGQAFACPAPNRTNSQSFMGDMNRLMSANVAIDCVLIGQSELSDVNIDNLVGWAMWRAGRSSALPSDHPYRNRPPNVSDGEEPPTRYRFDAGRWGSWAGLPRSVVYAHRGQAAPAIENYTTTFLDNFETNTIVDDRTGQAGSIWFAPTHLGNIGVDATAQRIGESPSAYVHNPQTQTLALRLHYANGWKTGAFSSVNSCGQGRAWGKGIFEIRAKFPALTAPRPGFFPAFWAYGREHLFWRTRNRLETDFLEYDGLDGSWLNITQHVHRPALAYNDPGILTQDVRKKIAGYQINGANGFPHPIDIYDGEFHTWYAQIEDDFSYFVVDGFEVARMPTTPELAAEKYIMVDFAYDDAKGRAAPDPTRMYDMTIDYIRVRQKTSIVETVAAPFVSLPMLTGDTRIGEALSVSPNVSASHIEYFWQRDGRPIPGQIGPIYQLTAHDVGRRIRCNVRALSIRGQPDAWTRESNLIV